jgi:hypothetical protein
MCSISSRQHHAYQQRRHADNGASTIEITALLQAPLIVVLTCTSKHIINILAECDTLQSCFGDIHAVIGAGQMKACTTTCLTRGTSIVASWHSKHASFFDVV